MVSISKLYEDLMDLINQKFYSKSEVDTIVDDLDITIDNEGVLEIQSDEGNNVYVGDLYALKSELPVIIDNLTTNDNGKVLSAKQGKVLSESIGSLQETINNLTLSDLGDLDLISVTDNKGSASASTMNKLYIEVGNSKTDVYYTVEDDGVYSWSKLDTHILDDISIPSDVSDLTDNNNTAFTPKSHTHTTSQITNFPSTMTPSAHNHVLANIGDCSVVEATITYTDESTDTVQLVVWLFEEYDEPL